jgi:hypothetical protein
MTAWSLRFQRALFLIMSALLLAGSVGHAHVHHEDAVMHVEHHAASVVEEHCALCELLCQPTELPASASRSVRTIAVSDGPTERPLAGSAYCAFRVNDRGPPSRV